MTENYKKFVAVYFFFALLAAVPLVLNLLFVIRAHEHGSFKKIATQQYMDNALYGSVFNTSQLSYKVELVVAAKPKILVLGSSRGMQFREEFFNVPFVNAGGSMRSFREGLLFMERLLPRYRPEIILWAVDFWWFNENVHRPRIFPYHEDNGERITYQKLIRPYEYLLNGKITLKDYFEILFLGRQHNPITNYSSFGLSALKSSDGYRSDGSRLYGKILFGVEDSPDKRFSATKKNLLTGGHVFKYGLNLDEEGLRLFHRMLDIAKENDVAIVLLLPPLEESMFHLMASRPENFGYVEKVRNYLSKLDNEIYDFVDPGVLEANACEYIDGFHGGDVVSQRMLQEIGRRNKKSVLRKHIKMPLIANNIRRFAGRALSTMDASKYNYKEVDFLDIGCDK